MIKKSKQQGFSLLEILIAFSILAFSLGILLNIFSGGLRRTIVSEEYQQAVIIAQSKLAAAGVETALEEAKGHGKVQDKYTWSVQVQAYDDGKMGVDADGSSLEAFQVTVKVQWAEGKTERIVELTTLRLAAKQ
ncbi:MAG: prepilin-type N-terminal cleavage/methylation domain-containing protein [Methyloprofundus sp.]|nr:prepilin-type N-terminal cleavage/methylation domain-containing protein [Methyloprofundus sp.]